MVRRFSHLRVICYVLSYVCKCFFRLQIDTYSLRYLKETYFRYLKLVMKYS